MSEIKNRDLVRAYELIEADNVDEARQILDRYLAANKDNADAWWLYAYAVTDPNDAQRALENVLRINPDYPGAQELLSESEQAVKHALNTPSTVGMPAAAGISRLGSKPTDTAPDFLERLDEDEKLDLDSFADDDDDDDFDDLEDEDEAEERRQPNRSILLAMIAGVVLLVVIALAGLFLTRNRNDTPEATATTGAIVIVETPTADAAVNPTPAAVDFSGVYAALTGANIVENSAVIETTEAGQTFLVSVCSGTGRQQLNTALDTAMPLLAGQAATVAGSADAMGVRLVNCDNQNAILRTIYVTVADAQAFANGSLSADEFRRRRRAL